MNDSTSNRRPPAAPQHADRAARGFTGQPTAKGPPEGEVNRDPNTNSGYPAGGSQAPRGKDAYGREPKQKDRDSE